MIFISSPEHLSGRKSQLRWLLDCPSVLAEALRPEVLLRDAGFPNLSCVCKCAVKLPVVPVNKLCSDPLGIAMAWGQPLLGAAAAPPQVLCSPALPLLSANLGLIEPSAGFVCPCGCRQCYLLRSPREACVDNTTGERRRAKKKGSCEDRRAILKSSVREKMMMVKEDPMLFSNDAFSLEPLVSDS